MKFSIINPFFMVLLVLSLTSGFAAKIGKINYIEGKVELERDSKKKPAKVNNAIRLGDVIHTLAESMVEIVYENGSIIRIGENSQVSLEGNEANPKPLVAKGKIWANVQKMASGSFQVKTPVATAAVRGTVFRVDVDTKDSTATIALYDGKVDVGPADTSKVGDSQAASGGWGPPAEVSGPAEVSLETWISLDPGTLINVGWDGKYSTDKINSQAEVNNAWIKVNQARDKMLKK
jgi:hypothetical protein